MASQQQEEAGDIKMSDSTSSLRSIPVPNPPFNPSPFDPYQINKNEIKYDPVDTRELKSIFGEGLYRFFKPDKKHNQYHISLFLMSEDPKHYTWEGAVDLIEKVVNAHPDGGSPKNVLNYLSGVNPRSRGGFAVSCTYSFSIDMENPAGTLELYYNIDAYMANNGNICNYIGADRQNSRCHFYTNKNQVYHHKYIIFNIPLNITGLGVYDKQNSIKATDFIKTHIAPINEVGQIRWQRAKNQKSGLVTETIELETFEAIRKENKQVKEMEVKFCASGYSFNRIIKIVKRGIRNIRLDSYKVYDEDALQTNFMKRRLEYEQKIESNKQQEQEQKNQIANERFIANQPANINQALANAMGDMIGNRNHNQNNNNHNHNSHQQQQQQRSQSSPPLPDSIGGDAR